MARPTITKILARARKERDRIQRKAIKSVKDIIPPILGPGGRVAPAVVEGLTEVQNTIMDHLLDQAFADFEGMELGGPTITPRSRRTPLPPRGRGPIVPQESWEPRVRSDKQLINDQIQREALTSVNLRARKKDGSFKKAWDQRRVMKMAQKECTRERERLGLCKRKRKRGKNSR
jgi:hypothetical protein